MHASINLVSACTRTTSAAVHEVQRAYSDAPKVCRRGLDTGARGWRFAVSSANRGSNPAR